MYIYTLKSRQSHSGICRFPSTVLVLGRKKHNSKDSIQYLIKNGCFQPVSVPESILVELSGSIQ